jgi:dienelactone hydrolase
MLIKSIAVVAVAASMLTAAAAPSIASGPKEVSVVVQDIKIPVPGQPAVRAYLVRPQHPGRHNAGVLYLHWLEPPALNQNRTEFLAEAIELAGRGVVAVLPDLVFPWNGNLVGTAQDADSVRAQFAAVDSAYRALLAQPGVDARRVAVVGHDYGAMYGAMLTQREPGVRAEVFMAGDATWSNWFARFFLGVPNTPEYSGLFAGLDPIDNVSRIGSHLYLQWSGNDFFIPAEVRDRFTAANPAATVSVYPNDDHSLDDVRVHDDRVSWLAGQLGL